MMEWLAILYGLTCCASILPVLAMMRAWALRRWWPRRLFLLLAYFALLAFWGAHLATTPGMARADRGLMLVCGIVPAFFLFIGAVLALFVRQPRGAVAGRSLRHPSEVGELDDRLTRAMLGEHWRVERTDRRRDGRLLMLFVRPRASDDFSPASSASHSLAQAFLAGRPHYACVVDLRPTREGIDIRADFLVLDLLAGEDRDRAERRVNGFATWLNEILANQGIQTQHSLRKR